MNKYHKRISELGRFLPGWVKIGAVAIGVGMGGWSPGIGTSKAWADGWRPKTDEIKKDTKHIHTATVNVALQNRCFNFENTSIFLPKTILFVLFIVVSIYSVRKKSKTNNNT